MRCFEIMKADLHVVAPDDAVSTAALKMRDARVGFLPVVNLEGCVVGALTDRDLAVRCLAEQRGPDTRVVDVMSREVVAVNAHEDVRHAEDLMARHHKARIVCIDGGGHLVGVISLSDLAVHETASRTAQIFAEVTDRPRP
jgi:CBS domain-containing protein